MWIERQLSDIVRKAFAQFPAVVLSGARQAGKTSLMRHLFPAADYVTLDIPRDAEAARLDPEGFLSRRAEPLLIDEVQYVPGLLRHLKVAIDHDRRPGRFLLTGAQDFSLTQGVAESLAGRCAVLSLATLCPWPSCSRPPHSRKRTPTPGGADFQNSGSDRTWIGNSGWVLISPPIWNGMSATF